ncbi:hypothetical protein AB0D37_43345, partial [Streptomyces sp. NPDC048384]|uniref:hypothetical protein n=1 Tax=Streptomyces sp. NPDC048384 TaxID=3155487 RepID=UPI00343ED581
KTDVVANVTLPSKAAFTIKNGVPKTSVNRPPRLHSIPECQAVAGDPLYIVSISATLLLFFDALRASLIRSISPCVKADISFALFSHPLSKAWDLPSLMEYDQALSPFEPSPHPVAHRSR